jgi:diguanylate cyclase (GGDEF)-like protein
MRAIKRKILEQVIGEFAEPVMLIHLGHNDWPVALVNKAFAGISSEDVSGKPFADVVEALLGRELALELSESLRSRQETSFPVEVGSREYLLVLKPLGTAGDKDTSYCAAFFRGGSGNRAVAGQDTHHELLNAKRRIRDLTRDDPVTGLLNEKAFRDVLEHDWAVASREKSRLALVRFELDDFSAYIDVFGRHASDSCLRRVGQAIRRCLRRASDVVARFDEASFVVLSHASDEDAVKNFADQISTTVRELGLHHPRSSNGRFVTVTHEVVSTEAGHDAETASDFLERVLA